MEQKTLLKPLKEIQVTISDDLFHYYGGNQYWFPTKFHQVSGCGPVAAANITAHLALTRPEKYSKLYPFSTTALRKSDFINHMVEVRKHVKPGVFGLTSVDQFSENVQTFTQTSGVQLTPHILAEPSTSDQALAFITEALAQNTPVAMLILTHPVREFSEFLWHWMTIHHTFDHLQSGGKMITISSCGKRYVLDFELLWNKRKSSDKIKLIYFT